MKIAKTIEQLKLAISELRQSSKIVGLVPTMGALHDGHLSLVRECKSRCDATVVTIFVNPTQFAPDEDLNAYPRPIENDLGLIEALGADLAFAPSVEQMYLAGHSTFVTPPAVANSLEGEFRPTHFRGVATIVLKLFNQTAADIAFFGQKDYQQALVVRHMVRELDLPIEIVVCPIVRDDDGLALSSRNVYLDNAERRSALSLIRSLREAETMISNGETDGHVVMAQMQQSLIDGGVNKIDYAVVANADTLEVQSMVRPPSVLLIAAYVGKTRLIDNLMIKAE